MIFKILLYFAALITCLTNGQPTSHEDELRSKLLKSYNKVALPSPNTKVMVRFSILNFNMNEELQSLDMDMWTSMEWNDPRLIWDKDSYPGIKRLAFNKESLWRPDLSLYNSANDKLVNIFGDSQILVMPEGHILWVPPSHMKAACVMDMTYWPYDMHNCTAKFGSWVHSSEAVDYRVKDDFIDFETIALTSNERNLSREDWHVIESIVHRESKVYQCCPEEYISLNVIISLKRMSAPYFWTVKVPIIILGMFTLVIFLLHPSAGEKVVVGGVALALHFFFLFSVNSMIGHSTTHTPLILKLITKQLVLTAISVIVSGLVLRLVRDPHSTGLLSCLKLPVVVLSSCLCLGGYRQMVSPTMIPITRSMKGEDLELNDNGASNNLFQSELKAVGGHNEWLLLAAVVDRVCLVIYVIAFLSNLIAYSSVL